MPVSENTWKPPESGKDRTVPCVELMQASCFAYSVESGSQIEVISVAENNLGFHLLAQLLKNVRLLQSLPFPRA